MINQQVMYSNYDLNSCNKNKKNYILGNSCKYKNLCGDKFKALLRENNGFFKKLFIFIFILYASVI